jgi:tetratricopeptide (TPR) repeat protein
MEIEAQYPSITPPAGRGKLEHALMLHQLGQFEPAQAAYLEILEALPRNFDALHLLGVLTLQKGDAARAAEIIGQAIRVDASNAVAHFNLALAVQRLGRQAEALESYDRAVAANPRFSQAYSNRGVVLQELARLDEALSSYDVAIAIDGDFSEAHFNRGAALHALGRRQEALDSYDKAIALNSGYSAALFNRGGLLREMSEWDAALASYDRAIKISPGYAAAHCNRGALLQELNHAAEARVSFDRAIALAPDFAEARVNKALALLSSGDLERGWVEHEWRWKLPNADTEPRPRQPLWLGEEDVAGKTLLLRSEQGLGDTLQFCRYARLVADRGARVILEVQRPLVTLLRGIVGIVVARGDTMPDFDRWCPLLSLPLAFRTTLLTIPSGDPYIKSDARKAALWRTELGAKRRLRVGLCWSGGFRPNQPEHWAANYRRNIALGSLLALQHPGVELFSLQKGQPAESEPVPLVSRGLLKMVDFSAKLLDFSDTAALIENLELGISVDTATALLAGAMGKPVWILNRFDTCWRWLSGRPDSPWYPTATLYRQDRPGDWESVIHRVAADLSSLSTKSL